MGRLEIRPSPLLFCLVGILVSCGGSAAPTSSAASPSTATVTAKPASTEPAASTSAAAKPAASAQTAEPSRPSGAASATASGPASVAARWLDVSNNLDRSAIPALFTDAAVFIDGPPCVLTSMLCKGPAAIAKRLDTVQAGHGKLAPAGPPFVVGNFVSMRTEGRSDNSQKAGIERQIVLSNVVVQGDRIAAYVEQADLSDDQTGSISSLMFKRRPAPHPPLQVLKPILLLSQWDGIPESTAAMPRLRPTHSPRTQCS